jgi:hypothetical protein
MRWGRALNFRWEWWWVSLCVGGLLDPECFIAGTRLWRDGVLPPACQVASR